MQSQGAELGNDNIELVKPSNDPHCLSTVYQGQVKMCSFNVAPSPKISAVKIANKARRRVRNWEMINIELV